MAISIFEARRLKRIMNAQEQFEALVSEHYEALFRFALSLTRAEFDAWDLTQQTFCTWAKKGHQLRDPAKVKSWLFTTLHRAFLETQRRRTRFPHHEIENVAKELPVFLPEFGDRLDSAQVLLALAKLDERYQAAVALCYLEDWSYKEIATILEVPVGTVKSRIARGITQLREFLSSEDPYPNSPTQAALPTPSAVPRRRCRAKQPHGDTWICEHPRLSRRRLAHGAVMKTQWEPD
jgi:RNA polymerase sigma factor (sigma-70 family)